MKYEEYGDLILNQLNDISYISNSETYELLYVTKAGMCIHGFHSAGECIGQKCYQVLHGLDEPCHFCANNKLEIGTIIKTEHYSEKLRKWYDVKIEPMMIEDQLCRMVIARNITASKRKLEELKEQIALEDLLMECIGTLTKKENLKDAMDTFLASIGKYYGAGRAYVCEFDFDKNVFNNTFEWCREGVEAGIDHLQEIPLEVASKLLRKFETIGEFGINNIGQDLDKNSDEYKILETRQINSIMAAPLLVEGKIVGLLGVDDPTRHLGDMGLLRATSDFVLVELKQKRLTAQLSDALDKANLANAAKSKFLFNISHDVRTPMNAILGYTKMAEKYVDDRGKVLDSLNKLHSAGEHLQRLMDDVLDMTSIDGKQMAVDRKPQHLPTVLKDTYEVFAEEMKKKGIDFSVSWDLQDETVLMDRVRLEKVQLNTIGNAMKYTPVGGKVTYRIVQEGLAEDGYATYKATLKDTGIGMSKEFCSHMFEPFEREHTSTVNGIEGTGLGLAIAKSLVEQMNGTISCTSEQGVGTELVVRVTAKVVEPEDPSKNIENDGQAGFYSKRILVVEDNALNREIACDVLKEFGFATEEAEDGDIAVEMVRKSKEGYYDLILMDIQMPRMDGYQATKEIRHLENKKLANIPIVALTANAFDEDRKNALSVGMNEHVAKPIDVPRLIGVIQEQI